MSKYNNDQGAFDALVGSPDESRFSDISFPSHVSGLESFIDMEETLDSTANIGKADNDQVDDDEIELEVKNSLSAFLQISSPPGASTSNSTSLNESSSMSLSKLEALQGQMNNSFLNSHSDDSEREQNLQQFLQNAVSSEKKDGNIGSTLSNMIEQSQKNQHPNDGQEVSQIAAVADTPDQSCLRLNQTELDSLFLKEVRNRLQLSSLDSTPIASLPNDIDETLKEIEQTKTDDKETKALQNDIGEELSREIQKIEKEFDRSCFENVERPHLDGSSSDSDVDNQTPVNSGVSNFARTGIQTSCLHGNSRFNMQQELEDLNLQNIPERQLAEGIDNVSEVFGDGGGGGDGSSGHSDSDMGGDGGVAIRNARLSPAVGSENDCSDDDDDDGDGRTTPPSRERPVGGSGSSNVLSTTSRQVHFSNTPQLSSHSFVVSGDSQTPSAPNSAASTGETEVTPQDSRLSARYFLAASTPFKTLDQSETAPSRNWLNQTSFHGPSASVHQSMEERTLVGAGEFTMDTPGSMTLSRLRQQHGDTDWTFTTQNGEFPFEKSLVKQQLSGQDPSSTPFGNQVNGVSIGSESGQQPYNPFETSEDEEDSSMVDFMAIDGGIDIASKEGQFSGGNTDLEAMFNEDERVVAMNNNTLFKDNDETGVSEWSVRTQNQQINSLVMPSEMCVDDDHGRVSVYFKTKSKELGKLSGDGSVRPKFSDDSQEVVTPPAALPMPLVKDGSNAEHEQTIPMDVFTSVDNKTFTTTSHNNNYSNKDAQQLSFETPKSTLLKTHKRNSNTVLQKKQKRQILGEEASTVCQLPKDPSNQQKHQHHQQQQQQQHRNDIPMSTEEISTKPTVSVPSSQLEATTLLNDIRERRVSAIGLNDHQMTNMAKLIATMTGTDEALVYQLISLLPKNKKQVSGNELTQPQHKSKAATETSSPVRFSDLNSYFVPTNFSAPNSYSALSSIPNTLATVTAPCHSEGAYSSNYASVGGSVQKVTPYNNHLGRYTSESAGRKPISSVIPINAERFDSFMQRTHVNGNPALHTAHNIHPTAINNQPHDYLQSARIPDRYSDPQPIFDRLPTDQRLAVSVSPVRSNTHHRNIHNLISIGSQRSHFINNDYQSLRSQNLTNVCNISNSQFIPLTHQGLQASTYGSNVDSTFFQNPMQLSDDRGQGGSSNPMSCLSNPQNIHSSRLSNPQNIHSTATASSFGSVSDHDSLIHADSLSFPKDVNFEVCCIGTSKNKIFQLKNTNRCWIQCQLHMAFFAFNGRQMDHRCNEVFLLPPKVTIEPQSTEEIKIRFQPDYAGTYMLKLECLVTSLIPDETNLRWQRLPSVVNIDGVAEAPNVELIFNDNKYVDFGEMSYGSYRKQELKLLNKGRADVPVRLQILSNTDLSGVTGDDSGDLFQICSSSEPDSGTVDCDITTSTNPNNNKLTITTTTTTKLSIVVPGHKQSGFPMKPKLITLLFQAPKSPGKELEAIMSPPSEYTKQLLVETGTKNVSHLGDVFMKAVVGFSRLHSLKTMQAISFNTIVRQQVSRIIPLRNAGNITLHLQPKVIGATNHFTIRPDSLSIKPGAESEVKVTFSSSHSVVTESRLFVTLLPDGDQYEWCLRGTCTSIPSPVEEKPALFCNKLSLNWCGVAIGQSKQQKLVLRNSSDYKTVQLSVNIHNDHPNFEVQRSVLLQEKGVNRFEAVLKPQSELPVYVAIKPTCFANVNASLVLRVVNGTTKYVIPLTGYGGCGTLDINGAKKLNDQFIIEMGQIYLGKKTNINIMLRNSGSRASFVCMKCFSDVTSKIEYPPTHVTITPNNFVLFEKTSCQITITYTPLKEHALKNQTFTPAHLAIYSGDEVLRKEFRRYHQKTKYSKPHTSNTLNLLPITSDFMNETTIKEAVTFPSVADWESFFLSAVNRNLIALVAAQPQAEKLKKNSLDVRNELVPVFPNTKQQQLLKSASELWTITPSMLSLNVSDASSSGCKLKLINYSSEDLAFTIEPSADILVITPSRDKVPALSELGIRIDAKPSFLAKTRGAAGWDGYLFVQCNGDKKVVHVQVQGNQYGVTTKTCSEDPPHTTPVSQLQQQQHNGKPSSSIIPEPEQKHETNNETWSVSPRNIILNTASPSIDCNLQIVNYTGKELLFEFIWPAETLVITPSKDKVPPHSHLRIRVDAKPSFLSRQEELWTGNVYIQCNGQQKSINIQIMKPSSATQETTKAATLTTTTHDLSLEPHQHIAHSMKECFVVTPQVLEFDDTAAKHSADSWFTIKNTSDILGQWSLLSICPSYFKNLNGNSTISRVTYPVFQFAKQSGNVRAHQTIKLPVSFHPRDYGMYSQFWDLEVSYGDAFPSNKVRLELIGKGWYEEKPQSIEIPADRQRTSKEVGESKPSVTDATKTSAGRIRPSTDITETVHVVNHSVVAPISNRSGHVFIKDDILEFPDTKVGSKSELKFRLCNDSHEVQKVRVSGFRSPFSIILKHMRLSIRPKSYIRVPVYYTPSTPQMPSDGLLILTPEQGEKLCVKLTGTSLNVA